MRKVNFLIAGFLISSSVYSIARAQVADEKPPEARPSPQAFPGAIPAQQPRSLADSFAASLKRFETIPIDDELLVQANELQKQAMGAILPSITASANWGTSQYSAGSSNSSYVKFTGTQPLFEGLRDLAALRQKGVQTEQAKFARYDAARQLFYNVSTAYYLVLYLEQDLINLDNEIAVNHKQIIELEQFRRIGRAQDTDVLSFQANVASIEATKESDIGQLQVARDTLAFYTGFDHNVPLHDTEHFPDTPPTDVKTFLDFTEKRPDVKTAVQAVQAAEEGIPIAWGQHLPSVSLVGDYYAVSPQSNTNVSNNPLNWDLALSVSMPIFQGGIIQSQVRQAASVSREAELQLSSVRRTAEEEIRTFHDNFGSDIHQIVKLAEAADLAWKNYLAEVKNYRLGLVTNLDVFTSVTTWEENQRALDKQRYTMRTDYTKLEAATAQRDDVNQAGFDASKF